MQSPKNDFHAPTDNINITMTLISITHFIFPFFTMYDQLSYIQFYNYSCSTRRTKWERVELDQLFKISPAWGTEGLTTIQINMISIDSNCQLMLSFGQHWLSQPHTRPLLHVFLGGEREGGRMGGGGEEDSGVKRGVNQYAMSSGPSLLSVT